MRYRLSPLQVWGLKLGLLLAASLACVGVSVARAAGSASPALANAAVTIVDNAFQSPSVTVNVGDSVTWTNTGTRAHTSTSGTSPAPDSRWSSGPLNAGQSFSYTFTAPGVYPYFCQIHPSMTGSITVVGAAATTPSPTPSAAATATPTNLAGNATPTATPTGSAVGAAAAGTTSPTLSTSATPTGASAALALTATPTSTPTPSIPAPTNLLVSSAGPQPGTYTLTWTAPVGLTIQEYRVQTNPASGSPTLVGRAAGSQNATTVRVDPAMGYALAVYAVDTLNRQSGPSNVVNTAGAPTATPIPPRPTPSGQAPYGYGGAPVPGVTGTQPYGGATAAQPYTGASPTSPYPGAYPASPGGASPATPYPGAYPQTPSGSAYPQAPYGSTYPQVPYGGTYAPPRPPVYGPPTGWCPGGILIGGQCVPR
jgi:plastocyanin